MRISFCQYDFCIHLKIRQMLHNKKRLFHRAFLFIFCSISPFSCSLIMPSFCSIFAYNISLLYKRSDTSSPSFLQSTFFLLVNYMRETEKCVHFLHQCKTFSNPHASPYTSILIFRHIGRRYEYNRGFALIFSCCFTWFVGTEKGFSPFYAWLDPLS